MERDILNLIKNSFNVLIITHINPDGDTLGCASCFKSFLNSVNIKSDILLQIEDNFNFPNTYSFLPYMNTSKNFSNIREEYDTIVVLDTASIDRLINKARTIFENCKNTVVIDHHKTNKGFGKFNFVRGGISSTGEVLFDFFTTLNIKITKEMAMGLYVAILTDTGCFKYENTTPHTFSIASKLAKIGINTSEIADLCYTNKPKNLVLFQNNLVANAKFCLNDKIAYTLIDKKFIEKYNAKDEYTDGIAEMLRSVAGVEIAFVLKETDSGIKVSIRTKSTDATKIAAKFNGGGHKRAAGCTIKETLANSSKLLLDEVKKLI